MIAKNAEIAFIQNKIIDISYAKFSTDLGPEFCLYNNVIKTINFDIDGNIWFFTACKSEYAKNINQEFFACLDYYQKGRNYYLHITGKALIATITPEYLTTETQRNGTILIKYKILKAEYFEQEQQNKLSARGRLLKYISKIFYENSHKIFDFSGVS